MEDFNTLLFAFVVKSSSRVGRFEEEVCLEVLQRSCKPLHLASMPEIRLNMASREINCILYMVPIRAEAF